MLLLEWRFLWELLSHSRSISLQPVAREAFEKVDESAREAFEAVASSTGD